MAKNNKPKQKAKQQELENKVITAVAIALGSVLLIWLLILGGNLVFDGAWAKQRVTAATADGERVTVTDYNFFFYRSYYEFLNNVGTDSTGMYSSPDQTVPLNQQYLDTASGTTWQDFFDSRAEALLKSTFRYYHLAKDAGFTLTEQMQADIEYDYEEKIWFEAVEVNRGTEEAYLEKYYGDGMTKEIYMKNLTILYTAQFYKEYYKDNIALDNAMLDSSYAEKANEYRTVFYQLYYINGNSEVNEGTSMAIAKQAAEQIAENHDFEAFMQACTAHSELNEGSYWTGCPELRRENAWTSIQYLRQWLQEDRAYGDTMAAEAANGYYVAFFLESDDNDYNTVNLKYFTVTGDDGKTKVDRFLLDFQASDLTTASFFELSNDVRVKDYSSGNYHKIDSITYNRVTLVSVPEPALEWALRESRQIGDVTAVSDGNGTWYVLYFDGYDEPASRVMVDKELRTELYNEWTAGIEADISYKKGLFFNKTALR